MSEATEKHLAVVPEEQTVDLSERLKNMSLPEMVQARNELYRIAEHQGGELTPELEDLIDQGELLLKGKIDRVCIFKKEVIPAHKEALKKQKERLEWLEDMLDHMVENAILMANPEDRRIDGLAWRARLQNNPGSVVVDNVDEIPLMFKRGKFTCTVEFDPSDPKARSRAQRFARFVVQKMKGEAGVSMEPDKSMLKEVIAPKKGEKKGEIIPGLEVAGVHFEQGHHVRYEMGRAKPSKKPERPLNTTKQEATHD